MVLIGKKFHRSSEEQAPVTKSRPKPKVTPVVELPPNYKTTMCTRWESGHCDYGARCHFAHGEKELRDLPPKKSKMCPNWTNEQPRCSDVDCQYAHYAQELNSESRRLWEQAKFAQTKKEERGKKSKKSKDEAKSPPMVPGSAQWTKSQKQSTKLEKLHDLPDSDAVIRQALELSKKPKPAATGFPRTRGESNSTVTSTPTSPITSYHRPSSTLSNFSSSETTVDQGVEVNDAVEQVSGAIQHLALGEPDLFSMLTGVAQTGNQFCECCLMEPQDCKFVDCGHYSPYCSLCSEGDYPKHCKICQTATIHGVIRV